MAFFRLQDLKMVYSITLRMLVQKKAMSRVIGQALLTLVSPYGHLLLMSLDLLGLGNIATITSMLRIHEKVQLNTFGI